METSFSPGSPVSSLPQGCMSTHQPDPGPETAGHDGCGRRQSGRSAALSRGSRLRSILEQLEQTDVVPTPSSGLCMY